MLLLIVKSIYTLALFYFELPFLLSNPVAFCLILAAFNHIFALFLRLRRCRKDALSGLAFNFAAAAFIVLVAGGKLASWHTWAFSLLLSSVSFFELFQDHETLLQ